MCERWLAGTTRGERERYVDVLESHRGAPVEAARTALAGADLGASADVLEELAVVVSRSPVFGIGEDGNGVMRTADGRKFRFKKLSRFRGKSSLS